MLTAEAANQHDRLDRIIADQRTPDELERCAKHEGGEDCGDEAGTGGMKDLGCISRYDFLRGILHAGLALEPALGLNPYRLGVIGSTDSHNGTPGNTAERGWGGHVGVSDDTPVERLGDGVTPFDGAARRVSLRLLSCS